MTINANMRPGWQRELTEAVRDLPILCRRLDLPPPDAAMLAAAEDYPLLAPQPYLTKIDKGNPSDPLLLQILPQSQETAVIPGFETDPLGEAAAAGETDCLSKYPERSLILATDRCGVHCRFCFRRHFFRSRQRPRIEKNQSLAKRFQAMIDATACAAEELILSGGDPLLLTDEELANFFELAGQCCPNLRRLRIHSRLPVAIPERLTDTLAALLHPKTRHGHPLTCYLVLHLNHPHEIDTTLAERVGTLIDTGVPVLSQTVLLKGVNDDAETLARLFKELVNLRVRPYYLHQLDRVAGAAHFEVPVEQGRQLMAAIRSRLPGYAIPHYVREQPGQPSKVPLW